MKIVSFIERSQEEVVERILRHCGLWEGPLHTVATARVPPLARTSSPAAPRELELVPDGEFWAYQRRENQENQLGEGPSTIRSSSVVLKSVTSAS